MNRLITRLLVSSAAVLLLCGASVMQAESKNIADYTLRIRIYSKSSTNFYYSRNVEESKGEGRGDIFEGDDVQGVDFNFACEEKFKASFGYQTFPARWKKRDKTLEILVPEPGKPWNNESCVLHTTMQAGMVFFWSADDDVLQEPAPKFKEWMVKHQLDPENGKVMPIEPDPPAAAPAAKK